MNISSSLLSATFNTTTMETGNTRIERDRPSMKDTSTPSETDEIWSALRSEIRDRKVHGELEAIAIIKNHLYKKFFSGNSSALRFPSQLSLDFEECNSSKMERLLATWKRLFFLDLHRLLFYLNIPLKLVHQALLELLVQGRIRDEFKVCLRDEHALALHVLHECLPYEDRSFSTGEIIKRINNDFDCMGIEAISKDKPT